MALRKIVKFGEDDILRKQSREVTVFDERLWQLLDDMRETMANANGAGLAAVQVGVLRRVFVVDIGEGVTEYINPTILKAYGSNLAREGCLSVPGRNAVIERPDKVKIKAQNRNGEEFVSTVKDYHARAVCHELDHLNGIVYVDLIDPSLQDKVKE